MQLAPAYFNNIGNKTAKKRTPAQIKAQAEHDAYLRKNGVHPEQLAMRSKPKCKKLKTEAIRDNSLPCSNGFAPGGAKTSVFDSKWDQRYQEDPEMAMRERRAIAEADRKRSTAMPLYPKGPIQVLTPGMAMSDLGKRRP